MSLVISRKSAVVVDGFVVVVGILKIKKKRCFAAYFGSKFLSIAVTVTSPIILAAFDSPF